MELIKRKITSLSFPFNDILIVSNTFLSQEICKSYFKYMLKMGQQYGNIFHIETPIYINDWVPLNKDYESRRKI